MFAALANALPPGTAVDGKLVAFDEGGEPSFNAIQNADAKTNVVLIVFNVLVIRWKDVKQSPLSERLTILTVREIGGEGVVALRLNTAIQPQHLGHR